MEDAAEFLEGCRSIQEAAAAVAFRDDTSFLREFRRHFQCTPQEYVRGRCRLVEPSLSVRREWVSRVAHPPELAVMLEG